MKRRGLERAKAARPFLMPSQSGAVARRMSQGQHLNLSTQAHRKSSQRQAAHHSEHWHSKRHRRILTVIWQGSAASCCGRLLKMKPLQGYKVLLDPAKGWVAGPYVPAVSASKALQHTTVSWPAWGGLVACQMSRARMSSTVPGKRGRRTGSAHNRGSS